MAAPALNYPGGRGLGNGQSPITPAGAVRVNGRVDLQERDEAVVRLRIGQAGIGGSPGDDNFLVHHSEVLVTKRQTRPRTADDGVKTDTDIYVIPCANGWGQAGEDQATLTSHIGQVFVSTGRRMVKGQATGLALLRGGLVTLALTGPMPIQAGQRVAVVAPDPANPLPFPMQPGQPETKIPFWVVPFDNVDSLGSLTSAYNILTGSWSSAKLGEYKRNNPFAHQWAMTLGRSLGAIVTAGLSTLVDAGVVVILDKNDWGAQVPQLAARNDALKALAQQLMTLPPGLVTSAGHMAPGPASLPGQQFSLRQLFFERMFGKRGEFQIAQPDDRGMVIGTRTFTDPLLGEITQQCNSCLANLMAGLKRADSEASRLILGTALTNAVPGQDFDLHLGSNLI